MNVVARPLMQMMAWRATACALCGAVTCCQSLMLIFFFNLQQLHKLSSARFYRCRELYQE
jgi:hypothetical protein